MQNKTFENFRVDEGNQKAVLAAKGLRRGRSLGLCGYTGRGKTHLSIAALIGFYPVEDQSILERLRKDWQNCRVERRIEQPIEEGDEQEIKTRLKLIEEMAQKPETVYRSAVCRFVRAVDLIGQIIDIPVGTGEKDRVLKTLGSTFDCLCIDDIGSERETEASKQILYNIVDARYLNNLSTIVTTNRKAEDFYKNDPAIYGRLCEEGEVIEVSGINWRLT